MSGNDAPYYIDLVQLVAGLRSPRQGDFRPKVFEVGWAPPWEGPRVFAGAEQAESFLYEFEISDELISELEVNALVRLLDLDIRRLKLSHRPMITSHFREEGQSLLPAHPYASITIAPFYLRLLYNTLLRICEFQTLVATETRRSKPRTVARVVKDSRGGDPHYSFLNYEPETEFYRERLDPNNSIEQNLDALRRMPGFGFFTFSVFENNVVKMNPMRAYSATHAAWWNRARTVVGIDRHKRSPETAGVDNVAPNVERLKYPQWYVNSFDLIRSADRHKILMSCGYDRETADLLEASGILALTDEEYYLSHLQAQVFDKNSDYNIGTGGGNDDSQQAHLETSTVLIDSYYQASFTPADMSASTPLYGRAGISLGNDLMTLESAPVYRAKHAGIPKVVVRDYHALTDLIHTIEEALPADKRVLLRGQPTHYQLWRSPPVKRFLYGRTDVEELSLTTAASRKAFDFERFFARFQLQIQGILYSHLDAGRFSGLSHEDPRVHPFADDQIEKIYRVWQKQYCESEWDILVMGLAQHYGIPTNGLDVTDQIEIALWFALHEVFESESGEGRAWWYRRKAGWPDEEMPVVYVLAVDTYLKRQLPLLIDTALDQLAIRPMRQGAYLQYGGWGLHKNVCAEDAVLAVFLASRFEPPVLPSTEWLFPGPSEDPFYRSLLDLKDRALRAGLSSGYEYIMEYRPPSA